MIVRRLMIALGIFSLILLAFFIAKGISATVAKSIVQRTPYDVRIEQVSDSEARDYSKPDSMIMFNRNLFNQHAGESSGEAPVENNSEIVEEQAPIVLEAGIPILTDLRIKLVGTQVASDKRYSVAMILPLDTEPKLMQYNKIGDEVLKEARIIGIERKRVFFKRITANDRLEYIDTETTEEELRQAKVEIAKIQTVSPKVEDIAKTSDSPAPTGGDSVVDPSQIKVLGGDRFELPRATLEEIRRNPNVMKDPRFGKMPQVQPVYGKGGTIRGFRLLSVENGSIYATLGLKSGDILQEINGHPLDNLQKAMALFDRIKDSDELKLKINHKGRDKVLTYLLK